MLTWFITLPILSIFAPFLSARLRALVVSGVLLGLALYLYGAIGTVEALSIYAGIAIHFHLDAIAWAMTLLIASAFFITHLFFKPRQFIYLIMLQAGLHGLILTSDIFNLYVFFEIVSISSYVLVASTNTQASLEGAIKYTLIGMLASIFFLLAIVLIYLHTGTLSIENIAFESLSSSHQLLIMVSLLVAFGIKMELVPFNLWIGDIYEASSNQFASVLSGVIAKVYIIVFITIAYKLFNDFTPFIALGIATFVLFELLAYGAHNLKRIFGYASSASAGLLVALFFLDSNEAFEAGFLLLLSDALIKFALFLSLGSAVKIEDIKNFSKELKVLFGFLLLALIGLPFTSGFVAKMLTLIAFSHYSLALCVLIVAVIIIESIYLAKILIALNQQGASTIDVHSTQKLLLALLALAIVYLGVHPQEVLNFAQLFGEVL